MFNSLRKVRLKTKEKRVLKESQLDQLLSKLAPYFPQLKRGGNINGHMKEEKIKKWAQIMK